MRDLSTSDAAGRKGAGSCKCNSRPLFAFYQLAGRSSSLLPPLPDLAPLENEVPLDGESLKRAAKALAVLEELRRREAERDANRGEGHD